MKKKIHLLITSICIASITMGLQCEKEYVEPKLIHAFAEKLTLSPYKKTYQINDTIWITYPSSNNNLYDTLSGTMVSMDSTFLRMSFIYLKRYPLDTTTSLYSDINIDGVSSVSYNAFAGNHANYLDFTTNCNQKSNYFTLGFVPKKAGIFAISPSSEIGGCAGKVFNGYSTLSFTFDLADCNKAIYLSIPADLRMADDASVQQSIDRKALFFFEVK